jgi:8-oxo-dGTP pyrophosphatase MutT (NUDIX family)
MDMSTLVTAGWISVRDGRLLAVRTYGRDAFYLPGGKIEAGESPEQGLVREVREELQLELQPDTLSPVAVVDDDAHGLPGIRLRMHCYSGTALGGIRAAREIAEYAWLGHRDAGRCAPALRQVLRLVAG